MSDRYTYRTTWSAEDNAHVGLCAEFPSLSWLAPTPAAALPGIQRLVRECLADMHANGEAAPEPMLDRVPLKTFKGRGVRPGIDLDDPSSLLHAMRDDDPE